MESSVNVEELSELQRLSADIIALAGAVFLVLLFVMLLIAAVFGLIYLIRYLIDYRYYN